MLSGVGEARIEAADGAFGLEITGYAHDAPPDSAVPDFVTTTMRARHANVVDATIGPGDYIGGDELVDLADWLDAVAVDAAAAAIEPFHTWENTLQCFAQRSEDAVALGIKIADYGSVSASLVL